MPKNANLDRVLEESKANLVDRINTLHQLGESEGKFEFNGKTFKVILTDLEECEKASHIAGEDP